MLQYIMSSIIYVDDRICSPRFNKNPRFLIKQLLAGCENSRYFFIIQESPTQGGPNSEEPKVL